MVISFAFSFLINFPEEKAAPAMPEPVAGLE
jgi:hypothetical protein